MAFMAGINIYSILLFAKKKGKNMGLINTDCD